MAIGTQQYQVFNLGIIAFLRSENKIFKVRLAFTRDFQADSKRLAKTAAKKCFFVMTYASLSRLIAEPKIPSGFNISIIIMRPNTPTSR